MPNYDGGHYFLTTLAPVRMDQKEGGAAGSYLSDLQGALQKLPTAQQSPATIETAKNHQEVISPFAKTSRTHLCRFVVINDAIYNGRIGADPIYASAIDTSLQPTVPQHVDGLPCPYLMFAVDFDAILRPGDPLPSKLDEAEQARVVESYLTELWETSSAEMTAIYRNCQGFEGVHSARDFVTYLKKCQIETWMPFNDYYIEPADLKSLPVKAIGVAVLAPLVALLLAGLSWAVGRETWLGYSSGTAAIIALLLTCAAIYGAYCFVIAEGKKPWPAAKYGDLASVLKGLYIQQRFADFVIANQGVSDADLHKAFGAFLEEHDPSNLLEKTQSPGVIKS